MLRFYARLSARLFPFRQLFVLLAGAALAGFAATLLMDMAEDDSGWLMLALVVFVWAVCGLLVVHAFAHTPTPVAPDAPWRERLLGWLARAGHQLLAVVISVLCIGVVVLSFKSISIISKTFAG